MGLDVDGLVVADVLTNIWVIGQDEALRILYRAYQNIYAVQLIKFLLYKPLNFGNSCACYLSLIVQLGTIDIFRD